jgi:hypothetical protein
VKLQDILLEDLSIEERLQDAPRLEAPAWITADQRCQIAALACSSTGDFGCDSVRGNCLSAALLQ